VPWRILQESLQRPLIPPVKRSIARLSVSEYRSDRSTIGRSRLSALLFAWLASSCTDRSDTRPPVWSYLSAAITEPNCATSGCHNRATTASGLDFSTPDRGYTSLTGSLVIPFDPAQSRLLQLLRGSAAPAMPPDGALPAADVALIGAWILDGATDDRGAPNGAQNGPQP
jgi:cytochrome c